MLGITARTCITTPAARAAIFLSLALILSGCAVFTDDNARLQLVTQYSTLKLIDQSSTISAEDVRAAVGRARAVVETNAEAPIAELTAQVRSVLHWERLDVADRLLLDTLLRQAEAELAKRVGDGAISPEARIAVFTLLDWIEQATLLA